MQFSLRWEICPTETPFSAARTEALQPAIASGTIIRSDVDPVTKERIPITTAAVASGVYGPAPIITAPPGIVGWASMVLVLESFGNFDWLITLAPPGQPIQAAAPTTDGIDALPCVLVPASSPNFNIRSREIRAIKSGWQFIARPRVYPNT